MIENFLRKIYKKFNLGKFYLCDELKNNFSRNNLWNVIKYRTTFPIWGALGLEINSTCNRGCEWCPRINDRSGIRKDSEGNKVIKYMPSDKVYSIIDQAYLLGHRGLVKLHRLSEPLLDSRYLEFAKYVKDKGMILFDDTNGDVLKNDPELCAKLDGVVFGFKIGLYDYKDEASKNKEMEFWKNRFKKTVIRFQLPLEKCSIRSNSMYQYTPDYKHLLELPCRAPYNLMLIRYDGEVSLCCEDDQCNFKLGNAFQKPLKDIWWSQKHIKIARTLRKRNSRYHFKPCSKCVFWLMSINLMKMQNDQSPSFEYNSDLTP